MSFYRTLLWWLLLAVLGALAWELLSPDLGDVVVRWHGRTLTTTVAFALVAWLLLTVGIWALWTLVRWPFLAWQRLAQRQARQRLLNGLSALHEGRLARAESLLGKAAQQTDARTVALLGARDAALQRGELVAAATLAAELGKHDPLAAALASAEALLARAQADEALALLQPFVERQALPPRGQRLRGDALCALGRAGEAVPLLDGLRSDAGLTPEAWGALETRWLAAALAQCADVDALQQRWHALPARHQDLDALVSAYAQRAAALGLEADAASVLADAVDRQWRPALVELYGRLPAARDDRRIPRAEPWLQAHPDEPVALLCLARLCAQAQLWGKADDLLQRALARGAGAEAWELLGQVRLAKNETEAALTCFANALRAQRAEAPATLGGRSLREQIAAEAAAEQRNEHGLPILPR